jgi:hypothetical protein
MEAQVGTVIGGSTARTTPHDPEKLLCTTRGVANPYTPEEEQEVVKRLRELGYE